jgi:hypothetical protein
VVKYSRPLIGQFFIGFWVFLMERIKRKLFFWTLVISFFVLAPTIILYARGYRFDAHKGVFVYGGAITLKTNPQSAQIYLNGQIDVSKQLNRINSSQNITGLIPANYNITVSAPGYKTWTKKTDVLSGLSSEFWNVILTRDNYDKKNYDDTAGIDRFFISPQNKYIVYDKDNGDSLGINIFNISSGKTEQNFSLSGWKMIDEARKENIEWSPQEDYLSIPVEKSVAAPTVKGAKSTSDTPAETTQYDYIIIDPANNNSFDLNDFLGKKDISDVRWDPKSKGYLFFLSKNNLYRANVTNASDIATISENVSSFDLTNDGVYFVQPPNNLVFKTSFDGQAAKVQVTSSFPDGGNAAIDRLIIYDNARIAFIDANQNLFVYNEGDKDTYFKKLGDGVLGMHFSDDGKKLLFWSDSEISVYYLRDWTVQPTRSEDSLATITRYSEPIKNVQWSKDYEHVIFNTGKWVKIIELDDRDHRNCMDLINTTVDNPFIRYDNSLEYLYFTDNDGGNSTLRSIIFPEPTAILGIGGS